MEYYHAKLSITTILILNKILSKVFCKGNIEKGKLKNERNQEKSLKRKCAIYISETMSSILFI